VEVVEVEEVAEDELDYIQYSVLYIKINVLRLNSTQVMYVNSFSVIAPVTSTTVTTHTLAGGSLDLVKSSLDLVKSSLDLATPYSEDNIRPKLYVYVLKTLGKLEIIRCY
jgi:hypothetical protein